MIEIDGKEYRTETQWERVHRHVTDAGRKRGVTRTWRAPAGSDGGYAVFYPRSATRKWTQAELNAERKARKAAELQKRIDEASDEAADRAMARAVRIATATPAKPELPKVDAFHAQFQQLAELEAADERTAYQWVVNGYVPVTEARWRKSDNDYWYCRVWDVRYAPAQAEQLMGTAPTQVDELPDGRPYDGRPWW